MKKPALTLHHPSDTAIIADALEHFSQVLNGTHKWPRRSTALCKIYGTLVAVHVAPRLQGERACVHCGCTDSQACRGGCTWSIKHKATPTGVCSQCVPKEIKLVDSL